MSVDLNQYLPFIYDDVTETNEILSTEEYEFDCLLAVIQQLMNNQYIQTCDL